MARITRGMAARTVALLAAVATPAAAQDASQEQIDALKLQIELLKAKTELSQAELSRANVILDQLPSFEGKTTTDAATGKFEATILSAMALNYVASNLSSLPTGSNVLVLAGSEQFTFGLPLSLNAEMGNLHHRLIHKDVCGDACKVRDQAPPDVLAFGPALTVLPAAISAVAGMLRSDVTLTSIDTPAVDSTMLANAVAAALNASKHAQVLGGSPGSIITLNRQRVPAFDDETQWAESTELAEKMAWLLAARSLAAVKLASISDTDLKKKQNKDQITALALWLKDFDEFRARATNTSNGAPSQLVAAIHAGKLEQVDTVIRVEVEMAGGSLKNTRNIATFFGEDPLRVTGGLLASYTVYEKVDDRFTPKAWGSWACATDHLRLRDVRRASFVEAEVEDETSTAEGLCTGMAIPAQPAGGTAQSRSDSNLSERTLAARPSVIRLP